MRYDIGIIGTGPAGISAAITAKIRNKSLILLGSKDLSSKISKAEKINNYTGIPNVTGQKLAESFQNHLDALGIEITDKKVTAVYSMGKYFVLQLSTGEMLECSSVILACGVLPSKTIENEDKFLGRGVSYCATCDAMLCKGKDVNMLAFSKEAEDEAKFLSEVCSNITFIPMYKEEIGDIKNIDNIKIVYDKPIKFDGERKAEKLVCENGEYEAFSTFIIRDSIAPKNLVPGLKTDGVHAVVDLEMKTNIDALFACGDIAGKPYQYIKSAGQGNVAALSAIACLAKKAKENYND